jgi:Domain of unknown function (DUF4258)
MGKLWEQIREAMDDARIIVTDHAHEQMYARRIKFWQVLAGVDEAEIEAERPDDQPNPSVVVQQSLPDGTPVKVVWAWLQKSRSAKLVTVHFLKWRI